MRPLFVYNLSMFSNPQDIVNNLPLAQGMVVADIGAGSGFYILPISRIVGDKGKVYAVDIQQDFLTSIAHDAESAGRQNVEVVWGDVEQKGGTQLSDDICDLVLISNTLFQIEQKDVAIQEIFRILKKGGLAVVIDWSEQSTEIGRHVDHVVDEKQARQLFLKNGFVFDKSIQVGKHHYGIILKKI